MANLLPEFHTLLRTAAQSDENVDAFDLDSKNPHSKKEWDRLRKESQEAKERLIAYIRANPEALLSQLSGLVER